MKKFSLLILSVLLLSCSSDNSEDVSVEEGNFLDVYNGVIWELYTPASIFQEAEWYAFSPEGLTTTEVIDVSTPKCKNLINKWGIKDSYGITMTLIENSKNLLKIQYDYEDFPEDRSIVTITASENGNFVNVSGDGESDKWNKVSETCKKNN